MCAEPVINGTSLVEIVEAAEGCEPHYAGVQPAVLQTALMGPQEWIYRKVLSCVCERPGSSWAITQVKYEDQTVTWDDFRPATPKLADLSGVGPFRFEREQYRHAVFSFERRAKPVRSPGSIRVSSR